MKAKIIYIVSMLLAIGITIPISYLVLHDMTTTGTGILQIATNATKGAVVAGEPLNADFELATWKLFPFIMLIGALVCIVWAIVRGVNTG